MSDRYPLLVLTRAPYAGSLARASLDMLLSFAAFNQEPRVLFSGAGIGQLVAGQAPEDIGRKSLRRVIDSLPLYDVERVFVEEAALQALGVTADQLPEFAAAVDRDAIARLRRDAGAIVSL